MTIAIGDRLPDATLLEKTSDGVVPVEVHELVAGRKVVLFGLPGAYTGVCSTQHVPSFIRVADKLRAKGVAEIVCFAGNDPHVMQAWGEATGATAAGIRMLSDASAAFTRGLGLAFDRPEAGMFGRCKRCSLFVDDVVVRLLNVEENNGQCSISAGETLLAAI